MGVGPWPVLPARGWPFLTAHAWRPSPPRLPPALPPSPPLPTSPHLACLLPSLPSHHSPPPPNPTPPHPAQDGVFRAYAAVFDGHNGASAAEHAADRLHHVLAAEAAMRTCTGGRRCCAVSGCLLAAALLLGSRRTSHHPRRLTHLPTLPTARSAASGPAGEGPPATALQEEERVAAALVHSFEAVDKEIMMRCRLEGTKGGATGLVVLRIGGQHGAGPAATCCVRCAGRAGGQGCASRRVSSALWEACRWAGQHVQPARLCFLCTFAWHLPRGSLRPAGNQLYAAHCGDSRAVMSRGGEALRLTEDHKPNLPRERKRVEVRHIVCVGWAPCAQASWAHVRMTQALHLCVVVLLVVYCWCPAGVPLPTPGPDPWPRSVPPQGIGGRVDFARCWRVIVDPGDGRPASGLAVSRCAPLGSWCRPRLRSACTAPAQRCSRCAACRAQRSLPLMAAQPDSAMLGTQRHTLPARRSPPPPPASPGPSLPPWLLQLPTRTCHGTPTTCLSSPTLPTLPTLPTRFPPAAPLGIQTLKSRCTW